MTVNGDLVTTQDRDGGVGLAPPPGGLSRRRLLQLGAAAGVGAVLPLGSLAAAAASGPAASQAVGALAGYQPTFLRFAFSGNPASGGTTRWQWQGLQGNLARPSMGTVAEQFVYATAVQRTGDDQGITQCVRPGDVRPEWVLRTGSDQVISRSGDAALDVGNAAFRSAAAAFLVAKCRTEGWSGVLLDEVNAEFGWGWSGAVPGKYPTPASWQTALLGFVQTLAASLRSAGFKLAGNLGTVVPGYLSFAQGTVRAGMIPNSEFFVAGSSTSAVASTENGVWPAQVAWLEWALANSTAATGAGTTTLIHDKQDDAARAAYGLSTFLLVDNGAGAYGADTAYSSSTPYPPCFDQALALGSPTGARTQVAAGVWRRDFTGGSVVVNSRTSTQTYQGVSYAPTSAQIRLGATTPPPTTTPPTTTPPPPTTTPPTTTPPPPTTTPPPVTTPPRPANLFELLLQLLRRLFGL